MSTERIIGIDFGTSTSVVRVKTYIDGKSDGSEVSAEAVKFDGYDTLPSLIHWESTYDEYSVGYAAERQMSSGMGELFRNFKLDLLSADPDTRKQAEKLVAHFFNYIYDAYTDAQEMLPACDTETTYVSYPAKWPKEIAGTMIRIAKEAGFKNVKGIDEPSAAIHTVLIQKGKELEKLGLNQNTQSLNVLMIDMGAGTTDLALCRYTVGQKNIEIINTWPKADSGVLFGGSEIDESLWSYVKQYLTDCGIPEFADERPYLPKSKFWKESNVSPSLKKDRPVITCAFVDPCFVNMRGNKKDFPVIDRAMLENMLSDYLKQFPSLINGLIENTDNFNAEDVDLVILTGGHSQWYFAEEILNGSLTSFGTVNLPKIRREPERIIKLSRPQETVALGMVYQPMAVEVKVKPEYEKNLPEEESKERIEKEWEFEVVRGEHAIYRQHSDGSERVTFLKGAEVPLHCTLVKETLFYSYYNAYESGDKSYHTGMIDADSNIEDGTFTFGMGQSVFPTFAASTEGDGVLYALCADGIYKMNPKIDLKPIQIHNGYGFTQSLMEKLLPCIFYADGWLYYTSRGAKGVCRMRVTGAHHESIYTNNNLQKISKVDSKQGKIYFSLQSGGFFTAPKFINYCMNLDGSNIQQIQ